MGTREEPLTPLVRLAWTGFSVYMRTSRLLCTAIPKRSEMRAEAEALVESIKQAVGLLRRHL